MMLRVNKVHFPVTALGPGRRIGIWVQGCSLACKGCISRDTWSAGGGTAVPIDEMIAWIEAAAPDGYDGVTISGGEPFEQPAALHALLLRLHAMRRGGTAPDLLAYSGFPLRRLEARFPHILSLLDAIIPGPFVEAQAGDLLWRGSANQTIVPLTEKGRHLYASAGARADSGRRPVQLCVGEDGIYYIGVPAPGDMERLEAAARERGVMLGGASWHA
jgi:anaerobic ribonucleoside-triphosphate reductase activating protein